MIEKKDCCGNCKNIPLEPLQAESAYTSLTQIARCMADLEIRLKECVEVNMTSTPNGGLRVVVELYINDNIFKVGEALNADRVKSLSTDPEAFDALFRERLDKLITDTLDFNR